MKLRKKEPAIPLIFKMIIENNVPSLQTLMEQGVDIKKWQYQGKNPVQYAAYLHHWECVKTMLQHSFTENYLSSRNYWHHAGLVLLWAARDNNQVIMKLFFELIEKNISQYGNQFRMDGLIFSNKNVIWKDENGYTALHWAVHNNNLKICNLLVIIVKNLRSLSDQTLHEGDSLVCWAQAKNKSIPYELALSLQHIECAKEIAKAMSLEYIIERTSDEILWKTLFLNIEPGFVKSGYNLRAPTTLYEGFFGGFNKILSQKKKTIFSIILTQSTESKKAILASMFNSQSMFCQFFSMTKDKTYFNKALKILSEYENMRENITLDDMTKSFSQSEPLYFFSEKKELPESVLTIKEIDGFKAAKNNLEKQRNILNSIENNAFFIDSKEEASITSIQRSEEEWIIKKEDFFQNK